MNNGRKNQGRKVQSPARSAPLALLLLLTLAVGAVGQNPRSRPGSSPGRNATPDADTDGAVRDSDSDLEELGLTLKAAVASEALSEEEAIKIWSVMSERIKSGAATGKEDAPKRDVMLSAPRPGQIRVIFQPEFLRRDLSLLHDELDLDQDQRIIARVLLADYLEAYDLASSPLREALSRYRRTSTDRWMATALERAETVDPDVAVANARRAVEAWRVEAAADDGQDREKNDAANAWARQMLEVARTMDERLASLRARVGSELAGLDPEAITADDLVRMAKQLRADREQLRAEMTTSLRLITTETQRGPADSGFQAAMARVRSLHLLPRGRLGGESMDLWAALADARREASQPDHRQRLELAGALVRERAPSIADKLDHRTEATLDREIAGLELQTERERIAAESGQLPPDVERRRLAGAFKPFFDATQRELAASIAVRDGLFVLLEESATSIEETHPDFGVASRYRTAALRRGFPAEMRRRWSERAIAAALQLEDLHPETMARLRVLEASTANELQRLRHDAVRKRFHRDPELARDQITALVDERRKVEKRPEMWLGYEYEAFSAIDDRTESRLRAILTPSQMEGLPARDGAGAKRKAAGKPGRK
ncbi:MAG: coiled-coil domain-containing protein [Planctomycetota bacterium]